MKIGTMEFLVIFLIVFFVLGPEKTVLYARKLGKLLRTLKVYITSITGDLRETVIEPLQEIQEPLKDITAPLDELTQTVQQPVNELNAAVRELDQPAATAKPASSQADETKAGTDELEFAQLETAEPETDEASGSGAAGGGSSQAGPGPGTHVDADIEEAGDAKTQSKESTAEEICPQESDFKT